MASADDPEGHEVLERVHRGVERLAALDSAGSIRLVTLPMDDGDENAAMVNALQRHATVIVQKSLAEGFGLTVAEGMWKAKAVVASAVGGIVDQVVPGTGVLLDDPGDLDAFGDALASLLDRTRGSHAPGRQCPTPRLGELTWVTSTSCTTARSWSDSKAR